MAGRFPRAVLENCNTPSVLLIGGLDSAGMAGLAADQRFVESVGAHPCFAVTALTRQTPDRFLDGSPVSAVRLEATIRTSLDGLPVRAIKIGMLATIAQIRMLARLAAERQDLPWVLDPVRRASSGGTPLGAGALTALRTGLISGTELVTPNLPEAHWLVDAGSGVSLGTDDLLSRLHALGARHVLLKGGHADGDTVTDVFSASDGVRERFRHARQPGNFRGTGCALASSIAAERALGISLRDACAHAIEAVQQAMARSYACGPADTRCLAPR